MENKPAVKNILKKKITKSQVLNLMLITVIVIGTVFGYLYYKKTNIVTAVRQVVPVIDPVPRLDYQFSIYGPEADFLSNPQAAIVWNNNIYVADTVNGRIMVFDYTGNFIRQIGGKGNFRGAMQGPTDIGVYNNNLYVADYELGKVSIYSLTGEFIGYFAEDNLKGPSGMKIAGDRFYIFDSKSQEVFIFDSTGKLLNSFGGKGHEPGQFYYAKGITVDEQGNIYVADSNNFRIQVFTPEGKEKAVWKSDQPNNEQGYTIPRGVAIDKKGNVWTANLLAGGVSATDPSGKRLALYNLGESAEDNITLPTAVFVDENNRLYVIELGKSRVLVYDIR
ncbi:6-bladed beta-propeller [Phosphitispora sp. TUW77]|uniref:6-bladed beta-propeller n=1 Tax=Phosphitispora sp. TUW77 TaxID=3152361 RepID=UPI003AB4990A